MLDPGRPPGYLDVLSIREHVTPLFSKHCNGLPPPPPAGMVSKLRASLNSHSCSPTRLRSTMTDPRLGLQLKATIPFQHPPSVHLRSLSAQQRRQSQSGVMTLESIFKTASPSEAARKATTSPSRAREGVTLEARLVVNNPSHEEGGADDEVAERVTVSGGGIGGPSDDEEVDGHMCNLVSSILAGEEASGQIVDDTTAVDPVGLTARRRSHLLSGTSSKARPRSSRSVLVPSPWSLEEDEEAPVRHKSRSCEDKKVEKGGSSVSNLVKILSSVHNQMAQEEALHARLMASLRKWEADLMDDIVLSNEEKTTR
eukprot:GHVH01007153.1.p1 GENE.GHVH01007153.1~~GHVH01007153.1.p1  ORF type:complete len:360 (+),score=64.29 GHVH01007153.1:143-1081(+)